MGFGLALLAACACGFLAPRRAAAEDTALASSRLARGAAIALPRPLDLEEAARIRHVFLLRARGRLTAADAEAKSLTQSILFGHLLADRFLGSGAKITADDLTSWLAAYPDHPEAPAIYDLLQSRLPKGAPPPPPPTLEALGQTIEYIPPPVAADTGMAAMTRRPALEDEIQHRADSGHSASAIDLIARTPGLDPSYAAFLRALVAQRLFLLGDDTGAIALASDVLRGSGDTIGLAALVGGFSAWRLHRLALAETMFETAWQAPLTRREDRVAAAFWAARAKLRRGDVSDYLAWMRLAAGNPLNFYGMVARRALGMDDGFLPPPPHPPEPRGAPRPTLGEADIAAVDATPQGHRAFALLQVGQPARAEAELRCLWAADGTTSDLRHSLWLVARQAGLSALAAQLADMLRATDAPPRDDPNYPVPRLTPLAGYLVDPALVYGITLMESSFDPTSLSSAGARGLMQLMPMTAVEVAGDPDLADLAIDRLYDPALNLDLGQRFLVQLGTMAQVGGEMMRLLASYYSGPTAVSRWAPTPAEGADPLLFLESIPADDVRAYVRRGLKYSWVYAARFRLRPPGLDDLAAGRWPRFTPLPTRMDFLPQHLRP